MLPQKFRSNGKENGKDMEIRAILTYIWLAGSNWNLLGMLGLYRDYHKERCVYGLGVLNPADLHVGIYSVRL